MSITDELRKFAWKECPSKFLERVTGIADDIEQAHTMEIGEVADLFKDCIPLPKDADGETIRFGDVLSQFGEPMYVYAMSDPDPDQGDCMLEIISESTGKSEWVRARKMRHVKPDSWERIIRDAQGDGILNQIDGRPSDIEALIERCKRLAGEDE